MRSGSIGLYVTPMNGSMPIVLKTGTSVSLCEGMKDRNQTPSPFSLYIPFFILLNRGNVTQLTHLNFLPIWT
jgi:hypothetical protein